MNKNILLIIGVLIVVLLIQKMSVQENIGSAFFHRGKLADINQAIQKQVAKLKKEDFNIPFLKQKEKPEEPDRFNPNKNVISKYSFKTIKSKDAKTLDQVQVGMLESSDFAKPVEYTETKKLSEFVEVDNYNTGSGDISDLKDAYKIANRDNYFQSLKALQVRGGNTAV